jgi:hypothetical protein
MERIVEGDDPSPFIPLIQWDPQDGYSHYLLYMCYCTHNQGIHISPISYTLNLSAGVLTFFVDTLSPPYMGFITVICNI